MLQIFYYNEISTTIKWTYTKLINLNCITNSCNWSTYVTWRGKEYELSEDGTIVSKHVGSLIIYKLIGILLLLFVLQNNKNQEMYSELSVAFLKELNFIYIYITQEGQ